MDWKKFIIRGLLQIAATVGLLLVIYGIYLFSPKIALIVSGLCIIAFTILAYNVTFSDYKIPTRRRI